MNIKRILIPTDFSDTARKALDQAVILAAKFKAELVVLHARVMYQDDPNILPEKMKEIEKEEQKIENDLLEHVRERTHHVNLPKIRHEIIRGYSAPSAILGYLNNNEFDLVVIGTHGRSGLEHFLIGSVTEKVVRYARCPVITVHANMTLKESFNKIVVPFDFSEHSVLALQNALEMAESSKSEVTLFYVVEDDVHPALYAWGMKSIFEIVPDIKVKAEKKMDEIMAGLSNPHNVKIIKKIVEGVPHKVISEFVQKSDTDLLVIATHGLVGLDKFLLGSTTEKIIRCVSIPILTLKMKNVI
jgi:nucleotide-binding universal stress UspA family protein